MNAAFRGWCWYYHRRGFPPNERTYRLVEERVRHEPLGAPVPFGGDAEFEAWVNTLAGAHKAQITDIPKSVVRGVATVGGVMLSRMLGNKWTTIIGAVLGVALALDESNVFGSGSAIDQGLAYLVAVGVSAGFLASKDSTTGSEPGAKS